MSVGSLVLFVLTVLFSSAVRPSDADASQIHQWVQQEVNQLDWDKDLDKSKDRKKVRDKITKKGIKKFK